MLHLGSQKSTPTTYDVVSMKYARAAVGTLHSMEIRICKVPAEIETNVAGLPRG